MNTRRLGAAVLGAGWVADEHIKAYLRNPQVELRAVVSSSAERLQQKRERHRLRCDLVVGSAGDLVHRDDIQLVSICTLSHLHAQQAIELARAGKHLLIEKPIATTPEDLAALQETVHRAGVKAMAGFVVRFYPLPRLVRKLVEEGTLGEVFYAGVDYWHEVKGEWKVRRETSGGAMLMGGCHAVDTLRWLMGTDREVVEVHAYSTPPRKRADFDYHPNFTLNLRLSDGAIGRVGVSLECEMPYLFNIELMGTKGSVRNDLLYTSSWPGLEDWVKLPVTGPSSPDVAHHPFSEEINYFVNCLLRDEEPMTGIDDAVKTHRICFAAEASAAEGKPVPLSG